MSILTAPLSQAGWLDEQSDEDILGYNDPTSKVKAKETFFKYNANLAATKIPKNNGKKH